MGDVIGGEGRWNVDGAWACAGVRREEGGPWSGDGVLFMLLSQIPQIFGELWIITVLC